MAVYVSKKLRRYKWLCNAICPPHLTNERPFPIPKSDEDWNEIIYLGSVHLILPRLFEAFKAKNQLALLPADVSEALEGFYELNCLHNYRLRSQIIATTQALNQNGIRPIWLKGASNLLASNWAISSRTMLDLDLWVPKPEEQLQALEILGNDGYYIQAESVGHDYASNQHFAPIIKNGEPARLELHRHVVSPACAPLLTDDSALGSVIWVQRDGLSFGVLSPELQIIQSYLQCTEQAVHCLSPRGTVPLMKLVDFLDRQNSINSMESLFSQNSVLNRFPWEEKARQFRSHLKEYFCIGSPLFLDKAYLRRVLFALNFPRLEIIGHILSYGFKLLMGGKLGAISTWEGKLRRQLVLLKSMRP